MATSAEAIPSIEKKIQAGETLTAAEEKEIMSMPKGESDVPARTDEKPEEKKEEALVGGSTGIKKPGSKKDEDGETDKADKQGSDEEAEDTSDEKDGKADAAADDKSELTSDMRTRLQRELEKPEGAEDLADFSNRERGVFWELRKERLKRQRAEQEADELKFERMKKELTKPAPVEDDEEADPFKDRDEDDLLTVADVKKLLSKRSKEEPKPKQTAPLMTPEEIRIHKVEADSILARKGIKDFYDVIDLADKVLDGDIEAANYLREVKRKGNNVALAAYHLIKGSDKYETIAAKTEQAPGKVSDVNKKRAEKIEANNNKIRTTGGGGNPPAPADEYSIGEIAAMPPSEFGKLPKKTRDAIMLKFGSNPNVVL